MTAGDLIRQSLLNAGVVSLAESIYAEDMYLGLDMAQTLLDEWTQERTVTVVPGTFPTVVNLSDVLTLDTGVASAIMLNLALRLRDSYGLPPNKSQEDRAANALALVQANNQQQQPAIMPGVPATCLQVIFMALRMAGRINDKQSVSETSKDVDDAQSLLVAMIAQWQQRRWLVPDLVETVVPCTGAISYTVGATGDVAMVRPDYIEDAFIRLLPNENGATFDYPMTVLRAREDYNRIALKDLASFPGAVYYSPSTPLGQLFIWPVPNNAYELHFFTKALLPLYTSTASLLGLGPEYLDAVVSGLACRFASAAGLQPSPTLLNQARAALATVRNANLQVPSMSMPEGLRGRPGQSVAQLMGGVW